MNHQNHNYILQSLEMILMNDLDDQFIADALQSQADVVSWIHTRFI